jgi:hypothetical protein
MLGMLLGLMFLSGPAYAGLIKFYEGTGCTQDLVDHAAVAYVVKQSYGHSGVLGFFDDERNDEIKSLHLERVIEGTVITLYDQRDFRTDDDYFKVEVKKYTKSQCIDIEPEKLRTRSNTPDRSEEVLNNDHVTATLYWRSDGKVAGKVSSWRIDAPMGSRMVDTIEAIHLLIEEDNDGFPIGGNSHEYTDSDHEFRMHRPYISPAYFVTFKVDHDRGYAFDDYAIVAISTDTQGKPTEKPSVTMKFGDDNPPQLLVDLTQEVINKLPENLKNSKYRSS